MSLSDLIAASKEIDAKVDSYNRASAYYEGTDESQFLSELFDQFLSSRDFSGTLNYASIPVDAVADRLQLLTIKGPDDKTTELISQIWSTNKMPLRFGQFVLDILKYGEHFMSIWPDEITDEPEDTDHFEPWNTSTPVNHRAKIMFADAATTRAFYDDGGELVAVARQWQQVDDEGKDIVRHNLYYFDTIEKYWWYAKDDVETAKPWYDEGQNEWPMVNPFGRLPIFHYSTSFPHGTPEHRSLYGVQDALNKIFQTHIASIEFLGFPIVYTLMDQESSTGTADFEYGPIDDNDSAADTTGLKNNPGEVWALRAKQVGQLEPAGSTNFIESLKAYKEIASEISGLPARLFSSTDGQHPGADAVNAADAVLRQRVADRQTIIGETLKAAISFALLLAFNIEVAPEDISILWKPQKIELDENVIATLQFKMSLGVPREQILSEMGYSAEEVALFMTTAAPLPAPPNPDEQDLIPPPA